MFPTADEIALAIVTACSLTGDKPVPTCLGQTSRARHIAFEALRIAFPDARVTGLARCLGYSTPHFAWQSLGPARKTKWWREIWVDEVVGTLVADQYGEAAL